MSIDDDILAELKNIRKECASTRALVGEALFAIRDAEREIPERIRRFTHHMHSIHDIKYMYEELGVVPPPHLLAELERVDDRARQLFGEENAEGGAFNKVRREMATDPMNRFDHTRQLPAPTHTKGDDDEARKREQHARANVQPASGEEREPSSASEDGRGSGES